MHRVICQIKECHNTILPTTAESTGGICMPCFQVQQRKEREEYIKINRKTMDLYAGVKSPIEIIKIYHGSKLYDPLIEYTRYPTLISDIYQSLDSSQISQLIDYAIYAFRERKENEAKRIIAGLIAFTDTDLTKFLIEMIRIDDYVPVFLFTKSNSIIQQKLLNNFLKNRKSEGDLFEVMAFLSEETSNSYNPTHERITEAVSEFKKPALIIKQAINVTRTEGFKKSILGNINICSPDEAWPEYDGVPLNPVIQLVISDLPYIPKELEGIKYICIFKLSENPDIIVIRSYITHNLNFIDAPQSIQQDRCPIMIQFEQINDYPCNYSYHSIEDYLTENYEKYHYELNSDRMPEDEPCIEGCKILGWPTWIQCPVEISDSAFILQVDSYGLWDDGDTSTLYIFRDLITKEFFGFTQMF